MSEKQYNNLPPPQTQTYSRRTYMKLCAAIGGSALLHGLFPLEGSRIKTVLAAGLAEKEGQTLSRKEHFKPFVEGNAQWQYVSFQYNNDQEERVGITVSMSELSYPDGRQKTNQLLVMQHNLDTMETQEHTYDGTLTFNETTSTYTFVDENGNQCATLSYREGSDDYNLFVETEEFNTEQIDPNGLVLKPQGDLIPVSGDGNFTVASFDGGRVDTNYFADNIEVQKTDGEIIGHGRRDSENLVLVGARPFGLDIDHSWVHVCGDLPNGNQAYITAWTSKTGGDYRFSDIMVINPSDGEVLTMIHLNETDPNFALSFKPTLQEQETPPGQSREIKYQMAHGGKVIAWLDGEVLFEFNVDGDPGQTIDGKGMANMVEAHGRLVSGSILEVPFSNGNFAIWETTDERYTNFFPVALK